MEITELCLLHRDTVVARENLALSVPADDSAFNIRFFSLVSH